MENGATQKSIKVHGARKNPGARGKIKKGAHKNEQRAGE